MFQSKINPSITANIKQQLYRQLDIILSTFPNLSPRFRQTSSFPTQMCLMIMKWYYS